MLPLLFQDDVPSGADPFNPDSVGTVVLNLSADGLLYSNAGATTPCVDTSTVYHWKDASASLNHAVQASAGIRPTFRTNQQNGLPGVLFDGSDVMPCVGVADLAQPYTLFIVFKGHGQYVFDGTPYDKGGMSLAGGNLRAINSGTVSRPYTNDTPVVATAMMNGASSFLQINQGTPGAQMSVIGSLVAPYQVGGLSIGAFALEGYMFHVLLYSQALDAAGIEYVQDGLMSLWGL